MDIEAIRLLIIRQSESYRDIIKSGRVTCSPDHLHAIEAMTLWGLQVQEVGVFGCQSSHPYNEVLETGLRVIGSGLAAQADPEEALKLIADFCPTHLVIQVPQPAIFRWAIRSHIPSIALFSQTVDATSRQHRRHSPPLIRWLNHPLVNWVSSHGLSSCHSLQQAGVSPDKLIPWIWHQPIAPVEVEPRQLRGGFEPCHLLYVGPVISAKGVGDLLIAIAHLRRQGLQLHLTLMGEGETDRFQAQASELQISDTVEFLAAPSRQFLAARLRQADILVVPSRHEYPETNTALLEDGLSASIPMVTSDHPRFRDRVVNGVNAMIFPASNARALAHQIGRLVTQPHLYARLATAGQTRHTPRLTTWADLISNWLHIGAQDAAESHQRLVNQSMASGRYPAGTPLPTPISLGVTP